MVSTPTSSMLGQKITSAATIEKLRQELKNDKPISILRSPGHEQNKKRPNYKQGDYLKLPLSNRLTGGIGTPENNSGELSMRQQEKGIIKMAPNVLSVNGRGNYSSYTGALAKHCNIRYLKEAKEIHDPGNQ